jgi:hypothetical protein
MVDRAMTRDLAAGDIVGATACMLERIAADPAVPPDARKAHARAARALYHSPPGPPRRNADVVCIHEAVELFAAGGAKSLHSAFLLVGRRQPGDARSNAKRLQRKFAEMKKSATGSFMRQTTQGNVAKADP